MRGMTAHHSLPCHHLSMHLAMGPWLLFFFSLSTLFLRHRNVIGSVFDLFRIESRTRTIAWQRTDTFHQ